MPDSSSLLVRLQKYAPRENHSPRENFLTEVFAWVLERCPEFTERFVAELNTRAREISPNTQPDTQFDTAPEHWTWETQVLLDSGSRPDIVGIPIDRQKPHILIEVKLESPLGYKQLQKYKKGHKFPNNSKVFLLHPQRQSFSCEDTEGVPQIKWEQIDEIARDVWQTFNNGKADFHGEQFFFIDEFLGLLDEFGLHKKALLSNIPDEYENFFKGGEEMYILNAFSASFKVVNDLQDAFKRAADNIKMDENDDKFTFDNRWGRLGISLHSEKWNPGFFAGIIVDPRDHKLDKVLKSVKSGSNQIQPLYFCIVISIQNEYWHKKDTGWYKKFKKILEDAFFEEGYRPYTSSNKWHPIILYKELDKVAHDMIKHKSIEEDISRVVGDIYKKILKCCNLKTLNNALDELEKRYSQQQQEKDA